MLSGFAAQKNKAHHSEIRCITLITRKLQEQLVCNSAYDLSSSGVSETISCSSAAKSPVYRNIFATPSYVTYVTAARDPCIHLTYRIIP